MPLPEGFVLEKKEQPILPKGFMLDKKPESVGSIDWFEKMEESKKQDPFAFSGGRNVVTGSERLEAPFKGFIYAAVSLPQVAGSYLMEAGHKATQTPVGSIDWFKEMGERANRGDLKTKDMISGIWGLATIMPTQRIPRLFQKAGISDKYSEGSIALGKRIIASNQQYIKEAGLEPPADDKVAGFLFNLGSGGFSLGAALGVSVLTKSPHAAAALFGAYQKGSFYQEAIEAGERPEVASSFSTMAGIVEGSLEYIGLNFVLKKYGGRLATLAIRTGTEGIQEWTQEFGGNILTKLSFDTKRDVFRGCGQAALIGLILGAPASVSISIAERTGVLDKLEQIGIDPKSKEGKKLVKKIITEQRKTLSDEMTNIVDEAVLPEKAEPTPSPLVEEAKKYDTLEKFEKAFEFHGGPEKLEGNALKRFMLNKTQDSGGIFLTPNESYAAGFIRTKKVYRGYIGDKKILDLTDKKGIEEVKKFIGKEYVSEGETLIFTQQDFDFMFPSEKGADWATFNEEVILALGYDGAILNETQLGEKTTTILKGDVIVLPEGQTPADIYTKAHPAGVVKADLTFTQKLQKIEQGFKTVKAKTKAEIKLVQTEIIEGLEASDLEATDKAKFIRTIKNIQTQQQLIKQLPIIQERIAVLETRAQVRKTESQIKKELKRTKPLKVGQRRVGKYDYESNKLFEALRGYSKLTQDKAQTELDAYSDESISELDLIKKRFLSLKANGATASLEIHNAVLNDILRMKAMGMQAKGEIEFYKLIDRQDRIDEVLTNMEKIKADKKTIKTKIGNVYRRGFSNIYSMMNSIFGKDIAEKYDPEINESDRNTEVSIKTRAMTDKASMIYGEKNIMRKFTEMASKDYTITDFEKLTTEISKLEIIDIYNSIKNEKKAADYYTSYSKGQVLSLINNLTAEDVEFSDYLQDTVQEYRKILNQRNIEITGRDLGTVENYWSATSEFQVSVTDDIRMQGETPSAMKERAKGRVIPVPKNAWFKAQRHVAQAEHIANLSREYETLKRLLSDRKVKHEIKNKFGEDVYRTLMNQIENISLNAQVSKIDAVSNLFGKAINNWVTAKIAVPNINVFVRQLMSMGNYVENMNPSEWVSGFAEGIASPKKTFDYMWNNAPFLKERFNKGYSEAVREAISGAEKINATWGSYTKFLTSLVRAGDITAIIYGGYPLVKAEVAKGKTLKEAIRTFEKATLKAQQSGLSSSRSEFQNSKNPFTRLFLAFKNTSNQYFRKMVDATISYQNGDISLAQWSKVMTIYAVVQPILYTTSRFATKLAIKKLGKLLRGDDESEDWEKLGEELADDVITQLAVSPVNAVPILDDIVTFAMRKATGQKIYKVFSTPLFDDMETGIKKLGKKEITAKDWLTVTSSILEPTTALPAKTPIRYYRYLMGNGKKSTRKSFAERTRKLTR